SCTNTLGYDDFLNPFKHRYHPEHDNLDARFENVLTNRIESYDITREIILQFGGSGASVVSLAGSGDKVLGVTYRERITGLHKHDLHLTGTFWLNRVSSVTRLNQPTQ